MRHIKRLTALTLIAALLLPCLPALAAVYHTDIRVKLSIHKTDTFTCTPVGAFTLREDKNFAVGDGELEIKAVGGRVSVTAGGKTVTAGSLTLESGDYDGKTAYIRLKNSEHGTCTYLGNMTFDVSGGAIRAINTLPLEHYLYGVVPNEMSTSFPAEALKAQAVCARGYAMAKCAGNAKNAYDILDTAEHQVYEGYASRNVRANAAVDATAGKVMTYEGNIIEAYYSASNGGQTERTGNVWKNDLPYYTNADDPYDVQNDSSLEEKAFIPAVFNEDTLKLMDWEVLLAIRKAVYKAVGGEAALLSTVQVRAAAPSYSEPSRCFTEAVVTLAVKPEGGQEGQVTVTLPLEELRYGSYDDKLGQIGASTRRLRMRGAEPGTLHRNGSVYNGWFLTMRRYGHGIGLSQRGAQERARAGQSYNDILNFYYVGVAMHTVGTYETAPKLRSDSYRVRSWGVSGISPGTTAEKLLGRLESDGALSIVDGKGKEKTGAVATGDSVRTVYENGTAYFDLPVILYGDTDGSGAIDAADAEALQQHLLHSKTLAGAYLAAADVNHDGAVDALDLLRLIRYNQGDSKIGQGGDNA